MTKLRLLLIPGLIAALLIAGSACAAERMRLASVPLDMPLSDSEALDNQALEGLYEGDYGTSMARNVGGYLPGKVRSSGISDYPYSHIDTELKDGRALQLWFSSADDGRATFGISLDTPFIEKPKRNYKEAVAEVESAWGKPDLEFNPPDVAGTQLVQVYIDHTMQPPRLTAVMSHLPRAQTLSPAIMNHFWENDLREYANVLGQEFRGGIVVINNQKGKLVSEQILLVDLVRASTVFKLR